LLALGWLDDSPSYPYRKFQMNWPWSLCTGLQAGGIEFTEVNQRTRMTTSPTSLTADQVIEARKLLGWIQEELAGRAGVSRGTISQLESSARRPSDWCLVLIHRSLNDAGIEFKDGFVRLRGPDE
jgi:DNA-binding XRE family transcriptional regulator